MGLHNIGCVLRNTGSGFEILDDAGHMPLGVSLLPGAVAHTATNAIKVFFDRTYHQVVSMVVAPDERMAAEGVICGASVGLSYLVIYCYQGGVQLDPDMMTWPSSNLWVQGLMYSED